MPTFVPVSAAPAKPRRATFAVLKDEEIDQALLCLKDPDKRHGKPELLAALNLVKRAGRKRIVERMAVVRPLPEGLTDPMGQQAVHEAPPHAPFKRAVVLQCGGAARYHAMTNRLIAELRTFGRGAKDFQIVVLAGDEGAWQYFRDRPDVLTIRTTLRARPRNWMRAVIWCVARLVKAEQFLIIESDIVCRQPFDAIWDALDVAESRTVLGVTQQVRDKVTSLYDELGFNGGSRADLHFITGRPVDGRFVFNGGVIAAGRRAILEMERVFRTYYPFSVLVGEGLGVGYMDEFCANCAADELNFPGYLHRRFNHNICFWGGKPRNWNFEVREGEVHLSIDGQQTVFAHFITDAKNDLLPQLRTAMDLYPCARDEQVYGEESSPSISAA